MRGKNRCLSHGVYPSMRGATTVQVVQQHHELEYFPYAGSDKKKMRASSPPLYIPCVGSDKKA